MDASTDRTFVVTGDHWRAHTRGRPVRIVQGYLHVDATSSTRVRLLGSNDAVLTVRRCEDSAEGERFVEVVVARAAAEALLETAVVGSVLQKQRWLVEQPVGAIGPMVAIEVDVYGGALHGLVLAAVAGQTRIGADRRDGLASLQWLGPEVTGDRRYESTCLALHGRPAPILDEIDLRSTDRAVG